MCCNHEGGPGIIGFDLLRSKPTGTDLPLRIWGVLRGGGGLSRGWNWGSKRQAGLQSVGNIPQAPGTLTKCLHGDAEKQHGCG